MGVCTLSSGMGLICAWHSELGPQTFLNLGFYFGFREHTGFVVDVTGCLNETLLHELFQVLRFAEIRLLIGTLVDSLRPGVQSFGILVPIDLILHDTLIN